jgi:surface protein|tara:strand:+ start:532 stop:1269 length:738 start_codon:yes stop_codon:yes gene_type:complete
MKTITFLLFFTFSVSTLLAQDFYLNANGLTCMCPDAAIGAEGVVNDITYTKRTKEQITPANATSTCTSGIVDMSSLFQNDSTFDEDLSSWDVSKVTTMINMFDGSGLSTQNYDNILIGWQSIGSLTNDVTLGAIDTKYCFGVGARAIMETQFQWVFEDDGICQPLNLDDYLNSESITIFPNPTNDFLMINGIENSVNISIYNLLGAEVIAKSNTDKIDVSELSKGVYIINISNDVSQINKKFIKN